MTMELSVIIVSYNVCNYLKKSLSSVFSETKNIDSEIIVVDNDSSDGSLQMVSDEFDGARLIRQERNEGYAAACNRAIRVSSGEYILVLNPDTVVWPGAITTALTFMRSHPDAGAAGARMTDGDGKFLPESKRGFPSPLTSLFRFTGIYRLFPHSSFFNAYYLGHLPEDKPCRADILTGAFMLIRRAALEKSGLFDTSFFLYGEDIDLSWRIIKSGYYNYYLPEVRITHFKGRSTITNQTGSIRHFYGAMRIFTYKHLKRIWRLPISIGTAFLEACAITKLHLRRLIKK